VPSFTSTLQKRWIVYRIVLSNTLIHVKTFVVEKAVPQTQTISLQAVQKCATGLHTIIVIHDSFPHLGGIPISKWYLASLQNQEEGVVFGMETELNVFKHKKQVFSFKLIVASQVNYLKFA